MNFGLLNYFRSDNFTPLCFLSIKSGSISVPKNVLLYCTFKLANLDIKVIKILVLMASLFDELELGVEKLFDYVTSTP